jgi:hypothetical protein
LGVLKRLFIEQTSKNKKNQQQQFFLLSKIPFQRAHTLVFKQMNGRAVFKNPSKFLRGPSLKINKKKGFSRHHKRLRPNMHQIVVV